jgi:hypothetical protein
MLLQGSLQTQAGEKTCHPEVRAANVLSPLRVFGLGSTSVLALGDLVAQSRLRRLPDDLFGLFPDFLKGAIHDERFSVPHRREISGAIPLPLKCLARSWLPCPTGAIKSKQATAEGVGL